MAKKTPIPGQPRPALDRVIWLCGACGNKVVLPPGEQPGKCGDCSSKRDWTAARLVVVK